MNWSVEFPTVEGWYWFYGQLKSFINRPLPEDYGFVKVTKIGELVYYDLITERFLKPDDVVWGKWQPIEFPEIPER